MAKTRIGATRKETRVIGSNLRIDPHPAATDLDAVPEAWMEGYDAGTYGRMVADTYDDLYAGDDEMVETLAALAAGRPALELGIGTGRVALPLAARGIDVHGIDSSPEMVARLRNKPGGASIPVTIGDFAGVPTDGVFSLVYVVFNTFFGLSTQDDQVRCFRAVASHLDDGGVFAVEAFVFDAHRYTREQSLSISGIDIDSLRIDATRHDPIHQTLTIQQILLSAEGIRLVPIHLRYVHPSEMDLMARLAGLRLRDRWGGWNREPFTAASGRHISIYERSTG